jgi:hypothetical protein
VRGDLRSRHTHAGGFIVPLGACLRQAGAQAGAAGVTSLLAFHRLTTGAALSQQLFETPGVPRWRTLLMRLRAPGAEPPL